MAQVTKQIHELTTNEWTTYRSENGMAFNVNADDHEPGDEWGSFTVHFLDNGRWASGHSMSFSNTTPEILRTMIEHWAATIALANS